MRYLWHPHSRDFFALLFLLAAIGSTSTLGFAASATVYWQDNSTNEDGFKIERGATANYAEIASVGPNTQTYGDSGLLEGSTYCYRVRAFKACGVSSPSNESCATIPITTFALAMTKLGSGSGSVTSNPAGI